MELLQLEGGGEHFGPRGVQVMQNSCTPQVPHQPPAPAGVCREPEATCNLAQPLLVQTPGPGIWPRGGESP